MVAVSAVAGWCTAGCDLGTSGDRDTGGVSRSAIFLGFPDRSPAVRAALFAEPSVALVASLGSAFCRGFGSGLWVTDTGCDCWRRLRGAAEGGSAGSVGSSAAAARRPQLGGVGLDRGMLPAHDGRCGYQRGIKHVSQAEASSFAGGARAPDLVLHLVGYRPAKTSPDDGAMGASSLRGLYVTACCVEDLGLACRRTARWKPTRSLEGRRGGRDSWSASCRGD